MHKLHVALIVILAIFVTWFVTRMIYTKRAMEYFKTNFNPSSNNLEEDIKGYRFMFGDRRPDTDTYFGFDDSLESGLNKRLLPDIIPQDTYVKKCNC
jgi:hypothetical protein